MDNCSLERLGDFYSHCSVIIAPWKSVVGSSAIDYLLKTRRIRLSNVSRLLKSARSGEEKWKGKQTPASSVGMSH